MLVGRHLQLPWELVKWLAIISLAVATAIGFATNMAGGDERSDASQKVLPLIDPAAPANSRLPREDILWQLDPEASGQGVEDGVAHVWRALELQQQGDWEKAVEAWRRLSLPAATRTWRQIAIGHAFLIQGELESAEDALDRAVRLEPENAVARYFRGLLRLQQATLAEEWYEPTAARRVHLVSYMPVVPNSRSMYRLAAMNELERAIAAASEIRQDVLLVPPEWPTLAPRLPTVGDLLVSLGADRFAGKAHNVLSYLYLERGRLEVAEQHMDAAAKGGVRVVYGYRDLGAKYETADRPSDAVRAYAKAMTQESGIVVPGKKAIQNLLKSLFDAP